MSGLWLLTKAGKQTPEQQGSTSVKNDSDNTLFLFGFCSVVIHPVKPGQGNTQQKQGKTPKKGIKTGKCQIRQKTAKNPPKNPIEDVANRGDKQQLLFRNIKKIWSVVMFTIIQCASASYRSTYGWRNYRPVQSVLN